MTRRFLICLIMAGVFPSPCNGFQVESAMENADVTFIARKVVEEFYSQFEGKKIVFKLSGDDAVNKAFSEIIFHRYSKGHSKYLFTLDIELSKEFLMKQYSEYIFLPNGPCIRGGKKFYNGSEQPDDYGISAQLEWRRGGNLGHSIYVFWNGDFHDGDQYVSILGDNFWKNSNLKKAQKTNAYLLENSKGSIRVFLDSITAPTRFLGVETFHKQPQNGDPELSKFDVGYCDQGFEGWTLSYPGCELRKTPIEAIIKFSTKFDDGLPVKFESPLFKNGDRVSVLEEPESVYQYFDGEIKKVIDKDAVDKINSILELKSKCPMETPEGLALSNYLTTTQNSHCGVYAFASACAYLGITPSLSSLMKDQGLAGTNGASIEGLRKTSDSMGLYTKVITNGNYSQLAKMSPPLLLHFGNSYRTEKNSHWVTYLGKVGDRFRILDLPHEELLFDAAMLHTSWDGTAVAVSNAPIEFGRIPWATFGYVFGLMLTAIIGFHRIFRNDESLAHSGLCVLLTTLAFSCVWAWFSPLSFVSNPLATKLTESKVAFNSIRFEPRKIQDLRDSGSDHVIVDCRKPQAFQHGHIGGSINMPLDAKTIRIVRFLQDVPLTKEVIIYCQSDACTWAEQMSKRLDSLGYENVVVFEPGWRGYCEDSRHQPSL